MGWEIVEHQSAPASDMFDFTGPDLSAYTRALLKIGGLTVGSDGAFIFLQFYIGGVLQTAGYRWRVRGLSTGGTNNDQADQPDSEIQLNGGSGGSAWGVGSAAEKSWKADIEISNLESGLYKLCYSDAWGVGPSGNAVRHYGGGVLEQTGVLTGLRITPSAGTLAAGKATLYGIGNAA